MRGKGKCSDERGEGLRGGVGVRGGGGGRAALAAVLPDEGAVLVHARCKPCAHTTLLHALLNYFWEVFRAKLY